ncbi:hypothetical protein BIV24_15745 [Streptomyces colonosanans]|uniref:Uncharacterized protein n=1 Tax=Streptomyces colonosanans TaxID=1428652 RepID=A0A1S2PDP1_9ACTN|nr:hypothetical protein BIV24_15745 [Streptomyces colonosanans]
MRVDIGERSDRVRGVERLGAGQVLGHVCLDELDVGHVCVGGYGAFVLGRGQLDASDARSVSPSEVDGVVAGSGADVQDTAACDVTQDLCSRSDPFPGRPAEPVGNGWGVGAGQLALAVDLPGPGVDLLGGHDCLLVGGCSEVRCA